MRRIRLGAGSGVLALPLGGVPGSGDRVELGAQDVDLLLELGDPDDGVGGLLGGGVEGPGGDAEILVEAVGAAALRGECTGGVGGLALGGGEDGTEVGEGLLALGAIIAATAGYATLADWEAVYTEFNAGGVTAFVQGGGSILNAGLGIPTSLSATILATMAVLFAATTMDTGVRLQRFVVQEVGEVLGTRVDKYVGTAIVLAVAMGLTFSAGAGGEGGMRIWPLFGTTNQLLASLTLSIVAVILLRKKRNPLPALVPLVFVFVMSFYAAIVQLGTLRDDEDWLLLGIDVVIIVAAVWVAVEAVLAMRAARSMPEETDAHDREAAAPESATR